MTELMPDKRRFLIVTNNELLRNQITQMVERHILQCQFFYASDGVEAMNKYTNAPPEVLITQTDISKTNGLQLTSWVIKERKRDNCGMIIVGDIPDAEHFIDEVVDNQVQFFDLSQGEVYFSQCLARALNYANREASQEFRLRFLSSKETLIRQGDPAKSVFLVKRGQLQATHNVDGNEILLGNIESGEFVGEMAYINGEPRSADVKSIGDCELIEIPIDHLNIILFRKPAWAKALMKTLSKRLKMANENMSNAILKKDVS